VILSTQELSQNKFNAGSCKGQPKQATTFWELSTFLANLIIPKIETCVMLWKSYGRAQGLC